MDQSITEPIEIGKFLAAAMKETDLPEPLKTGLLAITETCPEEWLQ